MIAYSFGWPIFLKPSNCIVFTKFGALISNLAISLTFLIVGVIYSKKHQGLNNYLVANRSIGTFSLTTSLIASALGAISK